MDLSVSSDTIGTIIGVIAPGYFAIQAYSTRYSKPDKEFSRLLVECIAYGLFIVGIYNFILSHIFRMDGDDVLHVYYFLPLLVISYLLGWLAGFLRTTKYARQLAKTLKLPDPDDDFLRRQFKKLTPNEYVTIVLKGGEVFSGTPEQGSTYREGGDQRFCFNNVAWYNKNKHGKGRWEVRGGSVIISTEDILYIETELPLRG